MFACKAATIARFSALPADWDRPIILCWFGWTRGIDPCSPMLGPELLELRRYWLQLIARRMI
jgi:hypothetical protein